MISRIGPLWGYVKKSERKLVLYIGCQKCSSVKGALKKVKGTFKYKSCINDVVNREAEAGLDDDIERVESFMYLGDKLNAGGGCLSVVTARVRVGWMK